MAQEEAQGEMAQGHMTGDDKPGVVTEQATGERETMQAAEVAAEYHEPGVGDKEGDEEAGWERWREMRGEKEKGQRYKDQLDRAAGRSGRSGKDGYGTAQRDGNSAMEAKRSGDKDYGRGGGDQQKWGRKGSGGKGDDRPTQWGSNIATEVEQQQEYDNDGNDGQCKWGRKGSAGKGVDGTAQQGNSSAAEAKQLQGGGVGYDNDGREEQQEWGRKGSGGKNECGASQGSSNATEEAAEEEEDYKRLSREVKEAEEGLRRLHLRRVMQENGQEILREQQGWMTEYKGRERRKAEERGIIQETAEEFLKDWEEWQEWWQGSEKWDTIEWAEGLQENCSRVGLDELAGRVGTAVHNGEDRAQWDREDNPRGDSVSESEGSSDGREEGVQAGGGMDWRGEEEWRKVRYIIGLGLDEFELDSREVAVEKALGIMAAGLEKKWGLKGPQGEYTEKT